MEYIPISQIHPSPDPIRKSWDEGKMEELAQSIKERGVIVPIKVRPNGDGYEVVYGHRRVEAAHRAGLVEMPAIVEGMDDIGALIQALIENVQREDMEPNDVSDSMQILVERGYGQRQIASITGLDNTRVGQLLALQDESPEVRAMIVRQEGKPKTASVDGVYTVGERHVREVRRAGIESVDRVYILEKTARDQLTAPETRAVADAYKAARLQGRRHT
jgi:ParB/RepB/Spo0J family partition protein